ncbi:MAG TPA: hypothetical protein VFI65_19370 [Streptosporangiaceae bacterium]|nr:hypothetical protein [Streptosporangiaceae bacterium]
MNFDSDFQSARVPYAGRHRKTPAYMRAASHLRLPHLNLPPLLASRKSPGPVSEPALADASWPATTQPAA